MSDAVQTSIEMVKQEFGLKFAEERSNNPLIRALTDALPDDALRESQMWLTLYDFYLSGVMYGQVQTQDQALRAMDRAGQSFAKIDDAGCVFVTFGQGHTHRVNGKTFDADCVARVRGDRERVRELFGDTWHNCHDDRRNVDLTYFPRGVIDVE